MKIAERRRAIPRLLRAPSRRGAQWSVGDLPQAALSIIAWPTSVAFATSISLPLFTS
jgi:hypothetical protein